MNKEGIRGVGLVPPTMMSPPPTPPTTPVVGSGSPYGLLLVLTKP
jgi:hypothetical protein